MADCLLVTPDQLTLALGLESPDDERLEAACAQATAVIQAITGQTLCYVEDDEVCLDGSGSCVMLLPEVPVTDVSSVVVDGVEMTSGWGWSAAGLLEHRSANWPRKYRSVCVTYSHGYDPIPADLVAIATSIAGRFYDPDLMAGIQSESIGGYSYSKKSGLAEDEHLVLQGYRL